MQIWVHVSLMIAYPGQSYELQREELRPEQSWLLVIRVIRKITKIVESKLVDLILIMKD